MGTDSAEQSMFTDNQVKDFTQLVIQQQQKSSALTKSVSMNELGQKAHEDRIILDNLGPNSQNVRIMYPLEVAQTNLTQYVQPANNIDELKKQVEDNKLFLNMVVHDMRSPTVSIKIGLDRTKQLLDEIL